MKSALSKVGLCYCRAIDIPSIFVNACKLLFALLTPSLYVAYSGDDISNNWLNLHLIAPVSHGSRAKRLCFGLEVFVNAKTELERFQDIPEYSQINEYAVSTSSRSSVWCGTPDDRAD
jgi:hypothetical protein